MRVSQPATRALVAVAGLVGLVDAQGFYSSPATQDAQCAGEGFVYAGCFATAGAQITAFTPFSPVEYTPGTIPSLDRSYYGFSFEGSNAYDNTVTPLNCARVCRGYGFRVTALRNNNCYCGTQLPNPIGSIADCLTPCTGDFGQTCGGGGDATQYYYDSSFAAPTLQSGVTNPTVALSYRYLGCYRIGAGVTGTDPLLIPEDTRLPYDLSSVETTAEACFSRCAGYGYPLASVLRSVATGGGVSFRCTCGTTFSRDDYRVRPDSIGTPAQCTTGCDGTANCDGNVVSPLTNLAVKCCAVASAIYAPVYINPLLQGCFKPQIPGFKDSDTDRTFECYDVPADRLGPPGPRPPAAPAASTLSPASTALARPPIVSATSNPAPRPYYLLGCYEAPSGLLSGLFTSVSTLLGVNTLDECANRCNSGLLGLGITTYDIFAVANGGQCYCGSTLVGSPNDNRRTMGACNRRCSGAPSTACGGTDRIVVYIANPAASAAGYLSYSATYLASPRPTYSCIPTAIAAGTVTATTTATTISTSITTVTSVTTATSLVTTVVAGTTVTSNVTQVFTTIFTSAVAGVTRTLINPGATTTINNTLIDAGSTLTLINPGATTTVVSTLTVGGSTITTTVTGVVQGTGPVQSCGDEGCTLKLRYGALRFPATTPDGAVCVIRTRSWVLGATTVLPYM
ncbi:hypothetical protein QBC34DRAFT_206604 [Podospora aff. communis PSN243]|uniref:WSC domain-containing protein n=1 Tax=Podospora aff. communis PSN243 TaxID=3040156 RepID=A0AAV9H044_9PEZI|nr:hypothetical protein QBC34DRAFT_206604 [Podospora aff. communis PSN243]